MRFSWINKKRQRQQQTFMSLIILQVEISSSNLQATHLWKRLFQYLMMSPLHSVTFSQDIRKIASGDPKCQLECFPRISILFNHIYKSLVGRQRIHQPSRSLVENDDPWLLRSLRWGSPQSSVCKSLPTRICAQLVDVVVITSLEIV